MRFASAAALIFGAVSGAEQSSDVEVRDAVDIGGLGSLTYSYWWTWDDATPTAVRFFETFEVALADGAEFATGDEAQWWWCETKLYDEAVPNEVLCNLYNYERDRGLEWRALTVNMDDVDKVRGDV